MNSWCGRCGSPRRDVGARQAFALVVVWAHGCLGLHFWLRYRPWYPAAAPWLLIAAGAGSGPGAARLCRCRPGDRDDGPAATAASVDQSLIPAALERKDLITNRSMPCFAALRRGAAWPAGSCATAASGATSSRSATRAARSCACRRASACSRRAASAASRIIRCAAARAAARPAAIRVTRGP